MATQDPMKAPPNQRANVFFALGVFAAASIPRLLLVQFFPWFEGDGTVYVAVARNILENACVSMSDPQSAACVPHWGGNQPPGYPAFIAVAWKLTSGAAASPLIIQTLVFSAAATYLALVTKNAHGRVAGIFVAAVVALSPTLIAWPRMLLTETLAIAAALWVFASLLRSLNTNRMRFSELGIACAAGLFIRYDFILVLFPIVAVAFSIHSFKAALWRAAVLIMIVAIPAGIWTSRNLAAGLSAVRPGAFTVSGAGAPEGVEAWVKSWTLYQYDLPIGLWPLLTESYQEIHPPDRAYMNDVHRQQTLAALAELSSLTPGQPVPQGLYDRFAAFAADRRVARRAEQWVPYPVIRGVAVWANPFASMGWPVEIDAEARGRCPYLC